MNETNILINFNLSLLNSVIKNHKLSVSAESELLPGREVERISDSVLIE